MTVRCEVVVHCAVIPRLFLIRVYLTWILLNSIVQRAIESHNYLLYMTQLCLQKVWHSISGRHHGAVFLSLCEVLNFSVQLVIEAQNARNIATPVFDTMPSHHWCESSATAIMFDISYQN